MPPERPVDLDEVLERAARRVAAGAVRTEWTEEVELHAPVVGISRERIELPHGAEAMLRAKFAPQQDEP